MAETEPQGPAAAGETVAPGPEPELAPAPAPAVTPAPAAATVNLPPLAARPAPEPTLPVRRAVDKVGRNEPCPCGSGKKYKKCCFEKDRARLADASPWAGLTMEEARRDPARHGDPRVFAQMDRAGLDGVDRAALPKRMLEGLLEAYARLGEHAAASTVIDGYAEGGGAAKEVAELREWLVYQALLDGKLDLAKAEQARRMSLTEVEPGFESELNQLTLALSEDLPEPLSLLELYIRELLDDNAGLVDLADAISLAGLPGLALVVTRAAAAIRGGAADRLIIEDLLWAERERLDLKSGDPALWLVDRPGRAGGGKGRGQVDAAPRRRHGSDEVEALKQRLLERESAIQKARSDHDRLAGELLRREQALAAVAAEAQAQAGAPVESEETRRWRRKVEELQAELREKQQERQELQRRLRAYEAETAEATRERPRGEAGTAGTASAAETDEGDEALVDEAEGQGLGAVRYTEVFYETAAAIDDGRLVLRAQETAARFGGLDPATWKQAKKMQDLQGVYTLRVGIHHRLFVTRKDGAVAARELVTRENFERTLKRYRRA